MPTDNIESRLYEVLKTEVSIVNKAFEKSTKLCQLGVSSMDMFMVIIGLEDEFSIAIDDEDINVGMTVGDLVNVVRKELTPIHV